MSQHPPWLIEAKLSPNALSGRQFVRSGLSQVVEHEEPRVVLIRAPAGYGKTSAMMQLYEAAKASGRRVAWLSLDEQDGDAFHFFATLSQALAKRAVQLTMPCRPTPKPWHSHRSNF